jgi:tRNA A37 threonylcarbamoyltransferase TsaD
MAAGSAPSAAVEVPGPATPRICTDNAAMIAPRRVDRASPAAKNDG